ncbi:MAG: cyclodeaminase/cyclohydrolase family protein [Candidatus Bipolaricaulota bacterium]|nr:cyclodeaminase/cyclohydrolase family protein [Candidatus Bipolaricaulota bacterium]
MQTTYENTTISAFLEELSSAAPAPGGGSVAALSGAMAASLVMMVCNLTIGKEKFAQHEQEIKAILKEALKLRQELMNAIDEDIQAYNAVIGCYRLPKGTQEEKSRRKEQLQTALKQANEVPYRTAKTCYRVLDLNRRLPQIGNPNAISDVAVSAQLAEAALQSALYNVDINCNYIKDDTYVQDYRKKRNALSEQAVITRKDVIGEVRTML